MRGKRRGPEGVIPAGQEIDPAAFQSRYHAALRRQSANRARASGGRELLPELSPGRCMACKGWGVVGHAKLPCPSCGGSGG